MFSMYFQLLYCLSKVLMLDVLSGTAAAATAAIVMRIRVSFPLCERS